MAEQQIRFDDGASYEQMMGIWSRSAGEIFLDWLAPPLGLRWIDIGCGNGAFTELLVERCSPAEVQGIDPSEEQLAFARTRPASRLAKFHQGDAMALPFADSSFDAAVMALVLVFVPDPAKGVSEMVRVVVPGGEVVTYMWDMLGWQILRSIQSTPRYRQWALDQRAHHEWMRLEWKHYETCGSAQALRTCKRERSQCTGLLQISMISG